MYKLNNDEKSYLRKIVEYTRKQYFLKNRYMFIEEDINSVDEKILISIENIEINFEIQNDNKISAVEIEKVFSDEKIMNIVKVLTLREKLVLFSYYFENKTDSEIGKAMNIKGDTIRKIRVRALQKIKNKYRGMGGNNNV